MSDDLERKKRGIRKVKENYGLWFDLGGGWNNIHVSNLTEVSFHHKRYETTT